MKIFVKLYTQWFDLVCDNYKRANSISGICNTTAINPIFIDKELKKIEFTYYNEYRTLRSWITSLILNNEFKSKEGNCGDVLVNIGRFLAEFHNEMRDSKDVRVPMKDVIELSCSSFESFLHCDLTGNNILINDELKVVIIDWEPTQLIKGFYNYGNVFWDVAWFVNTLLRPTPKTFLNSSARIKTATFFLEGYFGEKKLLSDFFNYYRIVVKPFNDNNQNKNLFFQLTLRSLEKNWKKLEKNWESY